MLGGAKIITVGSIQRTRPVLCRGRQLSVRWIESFLLEDSMAGFIILEIETGLIDGSMQITRDRLLGETILTNDWNKLWDNLENES